MRCSPVLLGLVVRVASAEPVVVDHPAKQGAVDVLVDRPAEPGAVAAGASLVAEGTELGEHNKFEIALDRFLAVANEHPSATHDCYVALAYLRIGRLTRARLWFDEAMRRGDPRPVWCATTIANELSAALATRGFIEITVSAEPKETEVTIGDGRFRDGRSVWLPPGEVEVRAEHGGYRSFQRTATVAANTTVSFVLEPLAATTTPVPAPADRAPRAPSESAAWVTSIAGVAVLAGGITFHVLAARTRDAANLEMSTSSQFKTLDDRFTYERALAIGGYAVGAATLGVGVWLFVRKHATEPPVSIGISRGGIATTWSWRW